MTGDGVDGFLFAAKSYLAAGIYQGMSRCSQIVLYIRNLPLGGLTVLWVRSCLARVFCPRLFAAAAAIGPNRHPKPQLPHDQASETSTSPERLARRRHRRERLARHVAVPSYALVATKCRWLAGDVFPEHPACRPSGCPDLHAGRLECLNNAGRPSRALQSNTRTDVSFASRDASSSAEIRVW